MEDEENFAVACCPDCAERGVFSPYVQTGEGIWKCMNCGREYARD